jgi:cytokinesis protein
MSSGGRESGKSSFFSRNKHKVGAPFNVSRPSASVDSHPAGAEEAAAAAKSSSKSTRSHHSRHSVSGHRDQSRDTVYGDELNPLNHNAGVVTSIPYDSVAPDLNRQPIPLDYARPISRGDEGRMPHGVLSEITPHSIARLGDFHQYPTIGGPQQEYGHHPGGPRPPPSSSGNSTLSANSYYAPGKEYQAYSNKYANNGSNLTHYPSSSTTSTNARSSESTFSTISSATRSSMISIAPTIQEHMHMPQPTSTQTEFGMERPKDDKIIETMFYELMIKRGYTNLPESAQRQLMAKPISGKWTMIYQDKLTDWQAEQKRKQAALSSGKDLDEDSPQWYVKKIMEGNITAKQLGSLSVSLRTQPIG